MNKLLIIFTIAALFGCSKKMLVSEHKNQMKLAVELERSKCKVDSVIVKYHYRDTVVYRAGATIYDTIYMDKLQIINRYIKDKEGTTALRVEYDSVLKRVMLQCEKLPKLDTIRIKDTQTIITKHIDNSEKQITRLQTVNAISGISIVILALLILTILIYTHFKNNKGA